VPYLWGGDRVLPSLEPVWTFWTRANILTLLGFKPWIIQPIA
jgi:hypothetical protein